MKKTNFGKKLRMKKIILTCVFVASLLTNCTEDESRCGNQDLEITDVNGNVIDCIEIPESPSF